MAKETTAVAEKKDQLPAAMMGDMADMDGAGFEDTTADDYAIPYLSIAQGMSKAMKKGGEAFIEGLSLGDIYDPVSGEINETVDLIPLHRQRFHVEWDDRKFIDRHPLADAILETCTRNEKGQDVLPNGNTIVDTVYMYALVMGEGVNSAVVISFARSSMKVYKKLMARANKLRLEGPKGKFQAPLHSHIYTVSTALETSNNGDDYYNWKVVGAPALITDENLWGEVNKLRDQITSGERTAADPQEESDKDSSENF